MHTGKVFTTKTCSFNSQFVVSYGSGNQNQLLVFDKNRQQKTIGIDYVYTEVLSRNQSDNLIS